MEENLDDIKIVAIFDGYEQSPTNEYLWRKRQRVSMPQDFHDLSKGYVSVDYLTDVKGSGTRLKSMSYKTSFDTIIGVIRKIRDSSDMEKFHKKTNYYYFDGIDRALVTLDLDIIFFAVLDFIKEYNYFKENEDNSLDNTK